jgi:excisionase family DNA binding protein
MFKQDMRSDDLIPQAVNSGLGSALEPLAVCTKELARLLAISVATLERWNNSGKLGPPGIKIGGRRLWPLAEVREWVNAGMPDRETWLALKRSTSPKGRK